MKNLPAQTKQHSVLEVENASKKKPQVTALGEEHLFQMCRNVWVWAELEGFDLLVPTLFPHPPKEGKVFGLGF